MDTGNYMSTQMDSLIERGLKERDEFEEKLFTEIQAYIEQQKYDWKPIEIIDNYRQLYKGGFYVSFTCKDVILKFEDMLKKLYP